MTLSFFCGTSQPSKQNHMNTGQHPFHFIYSLINQQFDAIQSKVMTVTCNPSLQVIFKNPGP